MADPGIVYRMAQAADAAKLAGLRWDFRAEDAEIPPAMPRSEFIETCSAILEDGMETGGWVHWVVENEKKIVAVMSVNRIAKIPKPNILKEEMGYLTNVYTIPTWRGQGIGSKLLDTLLDWAKQEDLEILVVWPSNTSRKFYQRAGFDPSEAMEKQIRPYVE